MCCEDAIAPTRTRAPKNKCTPALRVRLHNRGTLRQARLRTPVVVTFRAVPPRLRFGGQGRGEILPRPATTSGG